MVLYKKVVIMLEYDTDGGLVLLVVPYLLQSYRDVSIYKRSA